MDGRHRSLLSVFGKRMKLAFHAKFIDCTEAIGGDLLQVTFDTIGSDADEDARQTPCVTIGRLFEVSGPATIDWHDGSDCGGGARIVSATLKRTGVSIRLNRSLEIEMGFHVSESEHEELRSFLTSMLGNRIRCIQENPEQAGGAEPPSRVVITKDPDEFERLP